SGELLGDRIEAFDRAGVVVVVMADQDLLRQALDGLRIERQRFDLIGNRLCAAGGRRLRGGFSNRGESACSRGNPAELDQRTSLEGRHHLSVSGLALERGG